MKLKYLAITIILAVSVVSCLNQSDEKARLQREDSLRNADSVAKANEKQRIIDSVNLVTREQQIIADSIQNQVSN